MITTTMRDLGCKITMRAHTCQHIQTAWVLSRQDWPSWQARWTSLPRPWVAAGSRSPCQVACRGPGSMRGPLSHIDRRRARRWQQVDVGHSAWPQFVQDQVSGGQTGGHRWPGSGRKMGVFMQGWVLHGTVVARWCVTANTVWARVRGAGVNRYHRNHPLWRGGRCAVWKAISATQHTTT